MSDNHGMASRDVVINRVTWEEAEATLTSIRTQVFVMEQNVPKELEIDGLDQDCVHFLATTSSSEKVGTARLLPSGQIGRMAVLEAWRRQGIGSRLLRAAVEYAQLNGYSAVHLHAQTHALSFYERHGFAAEGPEFDDAGIPHRYMSFQD